MITTRMNVPLVEPIIGSEEADAVARVLRSGQLAQGPEVRAFEAEFSAHIGVKHAVAMNSGTAANHAALAAVGVEDGDEVITTPFTFAATSTPVLMQRARPRFVDIDPRTFNVDVEAALAAVGPKTRAAVLVDLFGLPFDRTGVEALAARGIGLVEDACQAVGARRDGRAAGTLGTAGTFSFYATKNIMTGEGGMLVTDDDGVAEAARRFRHHGQGGERYEYLALGYNYRLTDLLAAIGRVQLGRLDGLTAARRANAARYDRGLAGIPGLTTPYVPRGVEHAYHQYSLLVDGPATASGRDRDGVRAFLAESGVATGIYYPRPLHLFPVFAKYGVGPGDLPVAERVATQVLALPIHPKLSEEQVDYTIARVREAVGADR